MYISIIFTAVNQFHYLIVFDIYSSHIVTSSTSVYCRRYNLWGWESLWLAREGISILFLLSLATLNPQTHKQLILNALSLCRPKGTTAWQSSYDTGYKYIPVISESAMVGTVLQQGRYLTHDCIYKMTFVRYELLKYCLQARHMV